MWGIKFIIHSLTLLLATGFFYAFAVSVVNDHVGVDEVEESETIEDREEYKYKVTVVYQNIECQDEEERDLVVLYDRQGHVYAGGYVYENEETQQTYYSPVQDVLFQSKMLGLLELHLEEDEECIIYLDYLERTCVAENIVQ